MAEITVSPELARQLEDMAQAQGERVADIIQGLIETAHEHQEMSEKLRHSEGRLRQAMHLFRLGIWEWDPISDVTTWHGEMFNIYGIAPEEFTGKGADYLNFTHPEDHDKQRANLTQAFERTARAIESGEGAAYAFDPDPQEFRIVRPDGTLCWVSGDAVAAVDAEGKPLRMLGILQDITERKQADVQIQRRQQELEALLHIALTVGESLDLDEVLQTLLEETSRLVPYGTASIALNGENGWKFVAHRGAFSESEMAYIEHEMGHSAKLRSMLEQAEPRIIDDIAHSPDWITPPGQTPREGCWMGISIRYGDRVLGVLNLDYPIPGFYTAEHARRAQAVAQQVANAIAHAQFFAEIERRVSERTAELQIEIAERQRSEERLKRERALKENFIANAAHDLGNPVTALSLRLDILRRSPERLEQHIPVLEHHVNSLRHLVNDLLTLSRLDRGTLELKFEPTDIDQLVRAVIDLHAPLAASKNIGLNFQSGSDPLPGIEADPQQLERVISNLVSNALNYTAPGGAVSLETVHEDDGIMLTITDSGIGIASVDLPHIFERFYRGDSARKASDGTGLGLAIVKEIVEQHQGLIEVVSAPGDGTMFRVRLPLHPQTDRQY